MCGGGKGGEGRGGRDVSIGGICEAGEGLVEGAGYLGKGYHGAG